MKNKLVHLGIITIFCSLYFLVATISMINSVAFFDLAHEGMMNWSLAIGFELGAAASLAAIIILDKTNRFMVWTLFLLLTAFQMMANSYHAFVNLEAYMGWIELFGLEEMEPLAQKRILAIVSGAVLPVVALGFIKSLVDYIRPETTTDTVPEEKVFDLLREDSIKEEPIKEEPILNENVAKVQQEQIERIVKQQKPFQDKIEKIREDHKEIIQQKTPIPEPEPKVPEPKAPVAGSAATEVYVGVQPPNIPKSSPDPTIVPTDPNGEVEVRIEGDTTYVTTKRKDI